MQMVCEKQKLLAAPESELPRMKQSIQSNTSLFLFNFETATLYGPFTLVDGPGSLQPNAFGAKLRAQVRVALKDICVLQATLEQRPTGGWKDPAETEMLQMALEEGGVADDAIQDAWLLDAPDEEEVAEDAEPQRPWKRARIDPMLPGADAKAYVFHCNKATQHMCQSLRLLGAPDKQLAEMKKHIAADTPLLLFNIETKVLIGPLYSQGEPSLSIVSKAFYGKFNAQVRVAPMEERPLRQAMRAGWIGVGRKAAAEASALLSSLDKGALLPELAQKAWADSVPMETVPKAGHATPTAAGQWMSIARSPSAPSRWQGQQAWTEQKWLQPGQQPVNRVYASWDRPKPKASGVVYADGGGPQTWTPKTPAGGGPDGGYLFVCSQATQSKCEKFKLFGAPDWELPQMQRCVEPGSTMLFLLNFETLKLYGPFTAVSAPDRSIMPGAFGNRFTAHVRVDRLQEAIQECHLPERIGGGPKTSQQVTQLLLQLDQGTTAPDSMTEAFLFQSHDMQTSEV